MEDEAILAMTEKMTLEKYGYTVITASTGEKAVETVGNTPGIDLVLMDIDLGKGIDGTEAAEKILDKRNIPVVFLSSHTESEIVEKTEKITSYGYVVKNSSMTVLDASIKMAFKLFYANRKTEESEKRFHQLFSSIQTVNTLYEVVRDADGVPVDYRYLEVNPAFEKLVGMSAQDLVGKTLLEVFPRTERYWLDTFREIVEKKMPKQFEQYSTELKAYTELNVYLPQDDQLAMSSLDITARKRAENALQKKNEEYEALNETQRRNEARYKGILDNLDAGIVVHAADTSIISNNRRATELLGLSDSQLRGKLAMDPAWKFIHEDGTPLGLPEYPVNRIARDGLPLKHQILGIYRPAEDKTVWLTVNGFPMLDDSGRITEIVISFIDISDRTNAPGR